LRRLTVAAAQQLPGAFCRGADARLVPDEGRPGHRRRAM